MQASELFTVVLIAILFAAFWFAILIMVTMSVCKNCPYKDVCDNHCKDKGFVPPCQQYQNRYNTQRNNCALWQ